jgi:serine/threonine protein kinase
MNARLSSDPKAPRKHNPDISPELEEMILHAMERDPKDRYPGAAVMKAELETPGKVQLTGRRDRLQSSSPWKTRWHSVRIAFGTVLVTFVAFGLILFFFRRHSRKRTGWSGGGRPVAPTRVDYATDLGTVPNTVRCFRAFATMT